jgi:hypothetical protein
VAGVILVISTFSSHAFSTLSHKGNRRGAKACIVARCLTFFFNRGS